ncbi:hypothetical protein SAMN05444682_10889 [Parapedobacter indicus]|uniref:Uncharacterized protein n=1 Tax=Parapedobacter indicus TaxID=1477437 RepID=A0A1I3PN32_9SPHI|nr:hypothetical protein CLV26_10890 [Parapedobacter indicus]SFJ22436.1 hypothetical protein SAMN05444682_10889 [Parapedobacter indicus]
MDTLICDKPGALRIIQTNEPELGKEEALLKFVR